MHDELRLCTRPANRQSRYRRHLMRIIFLLQKEAWFVEHEQAWYRLNNRQHTSLALGCMSLNMVNQNDLIEQPHQAGSAELSQTDERSLSVMLRSPDGVLVDTVSIQLSEDLLLNVAWHTKQYRDGWMSADASVTLDDVGEMFLEAYLPAHASSSGKNLVITNGQTGDISKVWMVRDQKTRIPVLQAGSKGKVTMSLKCDPEEVDPSSDPRQLGFVLVAEEARPIC